MPTPKIARFVTSDKEGVRRYELDLRALGWTFVPCPTELDFAHYELSRVTEEKAGLVIFKGMGLQPSSGYRSAKGDGRIFTSENTRNWNCSNIALIDNLMGANPLVFPRHAMFIVNNPVHLKGLEDEVYAKKDPFLKLLWAGLNYVEDFSVGKDASLAINAYWNSVFANEGEK